MKITLLTGVIGSGKDFYAEEYTRLNPTEKIKHLHFAGTLRDITEGMFNIPKGDDKAYTEWKSIPDNRKFMVDLGQNLKRVYGENFFAIKVAQEIERLQSDYDTFIVSDFRFPVEFWAIWAGFRFNTEVVFCNYKSPRYEIRPEQVSEQMAIWLLKNGFKERQAMIANEFAKVMAKYEMNK